jgi:hypothetical protein
MPDFYVGGRIWGEWGGHVWCHTPTPDSAHHSRWHLSAPFWVTTMGSQDPCLGVCPRCGDQIQERHILVEYGSGEQPRYWAGCPGCGEVVDPKT